MREIKTGTGPRAFDLPKETLQDIEFGINTYRTALKEKLMGRKEGANRGEFEISYNSKTTLSLVMCGIMVVVLFVINKRISDH